tara:strand:+ start:51985 stop:52110 length:126 start_codon:yes stop_codon:yes gene_type:complete
VSGNLCRDMLTSLDEYDRLSVSGLFSGNVERYVRAALLFNA